MTCGYLSREEDDLFFDPRDDLSSFSDSCPPSPAIGQASIPEEKSAKWVSSDPVYQQWTKSPGTIQERRSKFMNLMGLDPISNPNSDSILLKRDSMADLTSKSNFSNDAYLEGCSAKDSNHDFSITSIPNCAKQSVCEENRIFLPSIYSEQPLRRNACSSSTNSEKLRKRVGWLKRLGSVACIVDRRSNNKSVSDIISDLKESSSDKLRRIRVRPHRKQSKEFSAVYAGQNFRAHDGAILAMKFSPDGEHLATSGEDGVVRVWQVMECARSGKYDIPNDDPNCVYFTLSRNTDSSHYHADKEKMVGSKGSKTASDSACVVVPSEVFCVSEKPLYEFQGHKGDVLDLAWSNNKCLLSSSADKTVRLWQLGCDGCLKVFAHNNYVSCVQFNPNDERYFISGSIDGKVRIWEISTRRVVLWADVKEIVTAVCYHPDGKGVVVGSIMGNCCFYDVSDNHLRLNRKISLDGKKKSVEKRITGFQFCPTSNSKLMVTSADSTIRILHSFSVISKYKGLQNPGTRISAAFTSDGQHIVSASEDSKVYIWNHADGDHAPLPNSSIRSSESFDSAHVSVALPWQGLPTRKPLLSYKRRAERDFSSLLDSLGNKILYLSPSNSLISSLEFFADILHRSSATWPEEKLPASLARVSSSGRSQTRFLKASCQRSSSHAWGQVIVTAGWDGRIRSFQNYGLPVQLGLFDAL